MSENDCELRGVEMRDVPEPAAPSEPVAWAAVKDGGAVEDGRIWRHRDKAERFVANMGSYAMQQPRFGYEIVPLYTRPTPCEVTVTEEQAGDVLSDLITALRTGQPLVPILTAALHAGRAK